MKARLVADRREDQMSALGMAEESRDKPHLEDGSKEPAAVPSASKSLSEAACAGEVRWAWKDWEPSLSEVLGAGKKPLQLNFKKM